MKTSAAVKKVVIIGGGFAGTNLAMKLSASRHYDVMLVDRNNYNFFPPLLYQVATSFLEPSSISYPFRKLFRRNKVHFRLGELVRIEPETHSCYLNDGTLHYDYLVLATGAAINFYGNENIKQYAVPMKTLNDALLMRNRLLKTLEQASQTTDQKERKKLLTIVVAGGGPTGVEVAGMLGELRKNITAKDYPELQNEESEIYLLEGSSRLLNGMSQHSHDDALHALQKLNINVLLNTLVTDYNGEKVTLSNNQTIETVSLIWTAGVAPVVFEGIPPTSIGKGKRMLTDEYNKVKGVEDIYAIGDTCLQTTDEHFPNGHPQLAQTAIQQGEHLAKNFIAMAAGKPLQQFKYWDKGTMAVIGRNKAVVDLTKPLLHFKGLTALLMWLFVHVAGLLTYQNRIRTLYNWIIAYLTKDQSLRMLIRPQEELQTTIKKENYELQNEYQKH